jgi:hypothetical protein
MITKWIIYSTLAWFWGHCNLFALQTTSVTMVLLVNLHTSQIYHLRARLAQLSFTCRVVFRKQLHEQLHERGREPCSGSFTMCLTLWEWVFREAGQRVGQRVGCLAIEVVKLLVKLLMKLYQTGPYTELLFTEATCVLNFVGWCWCELQKSVRETCFIPGSWRWHDGHCKILARGWSWT